MKIAVGNQMIANEGASAERFRLAAEAGFDGVEVWIGSGDFDMETSDDDLRRLRDELEAAGLECSSVASSLGWKNPVTDPDDEVFAYSKQIARRQIEAAQILGTDAILVVTGKVLPDNPYRQAWDRMVGAFQELAPYAADHSVRIGAETCPKLSKNLMTPGECLMFLEAVGHDAVGIYLDTANVTYSGYAQDFIHDLGERIVRIHFKDFTPPDEQGRQRGTYPGNGEVDFAPIVAACRAVGYDAWAVLEFGPAPGESRGLDLCRRACESTRRILER